MDPVCYFEIPVTDLDRAIAFPITVFGMPLERVSIDGNETAQFPRREGGGITGTLSKGPTYIPGTSGPRIDFTTDHIEAAPARAMAADEEVLYPKTSIGELGFAAEFKDTEANCIALHAES